MEKEEQQAFAAAVLNKVSAKLNWVADKNYGRLPYTTDEKGNYIDKADPRVNYPADDGISWWTNGFFGGLMWLMYIETNDEKYLRTARKSEEQLDKCFALFYGLHHDVGFMYMPTAVMDYRLTGNEDGRKRGLHAATLLAGRYNPAGRFIRAWNENYGGDPTGRAIIDCLMNLSLLYWASDEIHDPRFREIAMNHADTAVKHFVRDDGSVKHIVDFDPETGCCLKDEGGQGYCRGSSWLRGQAWAVYGFTLSYLHSGREVYLETAEKVARYCIGNIPADGILPLDFRQPAEPALEDSCGAAILASGLLSLAAAVQGEKAELYRAAGIRILTALAEKRADYGHGCDAVIERCSAAYHDKKHHFPMIYADFFFTEALMKLKGNYRLVW